MPSLVLRRTLLFAFLFSTVLFLGRGSQGQSEGTKHKGWDSKKLAARMNAAADAHAGTVTFACAIVDDEGHTLCRFGRDEKRVMPTASLIKFPVMIDAYLLSEQGKVDLSQMIELKAADKVPGSGILTEHFSEGASISLRDTIRLMIRYSDNTATNLVVDTIGLPSTSQRMKKLDFAETQLHSKVYRRDTSINSARSQKYGLGSTTAADMVQLYEQLLKGELASKESCEAMLGHLATCDDAQKIARYLPSGAKCYHKTGAVNRSRTDAGIVQIGKHTLILSVLTTDNEDLSWTMENRAEALIANLARECFRFIEKNTAKREDERTPKVLGQGDQGFLVEAVQRTLNDRIDAGLSVDGDFGPATADAVSAFQKAKKLEATGQVGSDTWAALGTLITRDAPVQDPKEINSREKQRRASRNAALDLSAAPETTARAWVIVDGESGEKIAGKNSEQARHIASTTKLMTALLVFELAKADPAVLDEIVTFSKRADNTLGSTSGVRAGEQLPVSELLYGLLLPSGNDASVALAEHFGFRLAELDPEKEYTRNAATAYELFIAAMNRRAKELGMNNSHFENTHGLTHPEHLCSASDLAKLAHHALQNERLAEYVRTQQRGCQLQSVDGFKRNVLWKNTNRLLTQEGFYQQRRWRHHVVRECQLSGMPRSVPGQVGRNTP
ncbi:MAG: serine hydrolase [Planctomycetota bacterium]